MADKGSKALSEITSKRQYIYVQRIATIFQTGGYHPPALMNVYVYTYIFDVMKIVYSILHAMRAIVCVAHERENTVLPYKIAVTL